MLREVIFLSFPGQTDIAYIKLVIYNLDDYQWQPNFLNHTKLKLKATN